MVTEHIPSPIAQRQLTLSGAFERTVEVSIGTPEQVGPHEARCAFQVVGLADDSIQRAVGVDTLQALNLAFVGVRRQVKETLAVLTAFHPDVRLTFFEEDWQTSLPIFVPLWDAEHVERLERFVQVMTSERPGEGE